MIAEAIEKILRISQRSIIFDSGRRFDSATLAPIMEPMPAKLLISSLQGIVDFINFEFANDAETKGNLALLVGEADAAVVARLVAPEQQRPHYLTSIRDKIEHHFGVYLPLIDMMIWLQNGFVKSDERDQLLLTLGSIKGGTTVKNEDDGTSQSVTVHKGKVLCGQEGVKNPIFLKPYFTFPEIEQVAVPCTLRIIEDGATFKVRLDQADGGAWKVTARKRIAAWLHEKLPEMPIIS